MKYKVIKGEEIDGDLDVIINQYEERIEGEIIKYEEVLIHGNPEGLKSLAKLLMEIANLNQEKVNKKYLPTGAREHYHLRPGIELSNSSVQVIVGRLDAKGTGSYYESFVAKKD